MGEKKGDKEIESWEDREIERKRERFMRSGCERDGGIERKREREREREREGESGRGERGKKGRERIT